MREGLTKTVIAREGSDNTKGETANTRKTNKKAIEVLACSYMQILYIDLCYTHH